MNSLYHPNYWMADSNYPSQEHPRQQRNHQGKEKTNKPTKKNPNLLTSDTNYFTKPISTAFAPRIRSYTCLAVVEVSLPLQ